MQEYTLSDAQQAAFEVGLASVRERLELARAMQVLPSPKRRIASISDLRRCSMAVSVLRKKLLKSRGDFDDPAMRELEAAAFSLPVGYPETHGELDNAAFLHRWLEQAEVVREIAKVAERNLAARLKPRKDRPKIREWLIGGVLPALYSQVFQRRFPLTRGGPAMGFIRHCLDALGEGTADDETIMTLRRNATKCE
jgi:hypothetical protein